jgi:hypothetical protein
MHDEKFICLLIFFFTSKKKTERHPYTGSINWLLLIYHRQLGMGTLRSEMKLLSQELVGHSLQVSPVLESCPREEFHVADRKAAI